MINKKNANVLNTLLKIDKMSNSNAWYRSHLKINYFLLKTSNTFFFNFDYFLEEKKSEFFFGIRKHSHQNKQLINRHVLENTNSYDKVSTFVFEKFSVDFELFLRK